MSSEDRQESAAGRESHKPEKLHSGSSSKENLQRREFLEKLAKLGFAGMSLAYVGLGGRSASARPLIDCNTPDGMGGFSQDLTCGSPIAGGVTQDNSCGVASS